MIDHKKQLQRMKGRQTITTHHPTEAQQTLFLHKEAQQTIIHDICQRNTIEACGVLLGYQDDQGNWHIEQAQPLQNIYQSPVYFEFAPEELLSVELAHPDQIVGVYHSHPTGFPRASSTDCENMYRVNIEQGIPWSWLIIRGPFDQDFLSRAQGILPPQSIIAYHHYHKQGLQPLHITQIT